MSQAGRSPSEAEWTAFMENLTRFRHNLPANQQRMLDAMFVAAVTPAGSPDVQGHQAYYIDVTIDRRSPYAPPYDIGAAGLNTTPFQQVYNGLPPAPGANPAGR